MRWTLVNQINEMDYDLKELRWNVISEVDNVTREKLRLSDYPSQKINRCLTNVN